MRNLAGFRFGFGDCESVEVFGEEISEFTGFLDISGILDIDIGRKESFVSEEETRKGERAREGVREVFSAHYKGFSNVDMDEK
jgi:hypothetical protein